MLWQLLFVFVVPSATIGGFTKTEQQFIQENVPKELLDAFEQLTAEDRQILYEGFVSGRFLSTMLTENERIVQLTSTLISVIGKKIVKLEGEAKQYVVEQLEQLSDLAQKLGSGEKLNLDELSVQEQRKFRSLSSEQQMAVRQQFPVITRMGLFTNKKLKKIFTSFGQSASGI